MSTSTIKYVQPNLYISTINTKMAEIYKKMSGKITFVDKQKINDIITKVSDLKGSINTLKGKISNNEDIADSYFENVLTQLESCYQLIIVNVIEVPEENPEIQNLKDMINDIPKFPADFLNNWSSVKANADKVASVPNALPATLSSANWTSTYNAAAKIPSTFTADLAANTATSEKVAAVTDALPNTLSSANWTKIYNTVSSIPADFFTDWNKMSYITKKELTDALGISLGKIDSLEKILKDIDIE